jgi:putative hydrolase of the HAD superfamily
LIYGKVLSELHLSAEECLYTGDGGSNELEGARAAGMEAVQAKWYTNNHPVPRASMDGFKAAERPLELMRFIQS